jgi:putative membrane protein
MKCNNLLVAVSLALISTVAFAKDASDQDFVTKAGQGGMAEVELGTIAMDQGSAADVKKFGKQMVDDHSKANEELKTVAATAGAKVPDAPSPSQKALAAQLKQKRGSDFDAAYSKAMVKDHKEDIALFKKEATSGSNSDLKAFAQKTLPTLESHLKMAESLNGAK